MLQSAINTVIFWDNYESQHVYLVHKVLLLLNDMLQMPMFKTMVLNMVNKNDFLPGHVIKTLGNSVESLIPELQ